MTKTLQEALLPLAKIADAYDANALDDSARKVWGPNDEFTNDTPPSQIELYSGRGGRQLLTLADCLEAREALRAIAAWTDGESLDDVARRHFAMEYPGRSYGDIGDNAKMGWMRSAWRAQVDQLQFLRSLVAPDRPRR